MTKAIVSGSIYAEDPIFSPYGYARKVFGESNARRMTYTTDGNKMDFKFMPVTVTSTDVDSTLIDEITNQIETEYYGNIYFNVTYIR